MKKMGLVLSGGGARGAYQAGVLAAVQEISEKSGVPVKYDFLSGVSAGAINASSLASNADNLKVATESLAKLWSDVSFEKVFSTDSMTMGKIGLQWMSELSLGGMTGTTPGKALMDTAPLRQLIHSNMDYAKVEKNIDDGHLTALAITSIDYAKSATTTFIQGKNVLPSWDKGRKRSERTTISTDHIMASSAIPLLFPPVKVDDRFFGDGAIRNHAPCSPVIYLGAEKLLVIGVRLQSSTTAYEQRAAQYATAPSVARVVNTILNGALMDAVEQDVERLRRLNDYAIAIPPEQQRAVSLRPIDHLFISPSEDIGEMAVQKAQKLPRVVRYLLKGLGSLQDASELISYLLFEPTFCADLIEIGRKDGLSHKEELIKLLQK
ncbi:patatin-like phospholipase family protein [Bdellovibrio sp. NC01]|uniref:patatin-like phospholipase family protein n=1 Tax=Bdellovibrio sp. NC01 TaxID=2220073 RepID=UPI00115A572A|nr:patatin-like phospholipase family protein [Bdellovibrio sp. NC01]QDK36704.1 patatin family protein [Bdellovibrio sp. NC01]